jgi:hypothetical protein
MMSWSAASKLIGRPSRTRIRETSITSTSLAREGRCLSKGWRSPRSKSSSLLVLMTVETLLCEFAIVPPPCLI